MPNYNGQVRCSYCHQRGHNRRSCPRLTKAIQRRYEEAVKSNEKYNAKYWGDQLGKRTGTNPHTGEANVKRRREYGRTCSYCRESGHNRRKCPHIAADKAAMVKATATMRRSLLSLLRASGCVPGAMVTSKVVPWSSDVFPALILGIDWAVFDAYSMSHRLGSTGGLKVCRMDNGTKTILNLPAGFANLSDAQDIRLASPVLDSDLEPPAGWLDGEGIDFDATDLFKKGGRRDYWFWKDLDNHVEIFENAVRVNLSGDS